MIFVGLSRGEQVNDILCMSYCTMVLLMGEISDTLAISPVTIQCFNKVNLFFQLRQDTCKFDL